MTYIIKYIIFLIKVTLIKISLLSKLKTYIQSQTIRVNSSISNSQMKQLSIWNNKKLNFDNQKLKL